MNIAILDDYQDRVRTLTCMNLLRGHDVKVFNSSARGIGQLVVRLAPFDVLVLIGERTVLSAALLKKLPRLRFIAQTGDDAVPIDIDAATACGIAVAQGTSDLHAPAELAWTLIMAASRRIVPYAVNLQDGLWQTASIEPARNALGTSLRGQSFGIWGYGRIGRIVAGYANAFGMRVTVWGSPQARARAAADGHRVAASQSAFFSEADVLSLHLRLTDATRGIVSAADLACMKPGALLVNMSRAGLIAEGALLAALQAGRPGHAALDVFDTEPLSPDAPLLRLPNVLATPHLGFVERGSYEMLFESAFRNVLAFANGAPSNVINPAALAAR